jgi:hypothetical protein
MTTILVGVACFVLGGFFWVPVWAWVKGKLFPGSVPIEVEKKP